MAGTGKKWLIGCGVGCGVIILLNIILFVGAGFMLTQPMNKAVKSQKALEETFGAQNSFVPGQDSLSADRLEVFLRVRGDLMPRCEELEKIAEGFSAMEELDEEEDPSATEILKGLGNVFGSVKGIVVQMGELIEIRNEALVQENMSMGEYTWIYILAFNSYLGHEPNQGIEDDGGSFSSREQALMADLMKNHAQALEEAGFSDRAGVWIEEVKKLDWSDSGVPFAEGNLPAAVLDALAPYRTRLDEAFCPPMSEMDLGQIKKKGMSFHSD